MARPRNFAEDDVLVSAAAVFGRLGYNAASIDDLVTATGLQRGSLYKAFGSKRNLFEKVLQRALSGDWQRGESIDLMITSLKDLASEDAPIAALCRAAIMRCPEDAAAILGTRLLQHLTDEKEPPCQP